MPSHQGWPREMSWQAQQISLNHHMPILHLHLIKLLVNPFIFSAFTTYDIQIYIDLLPVVPFHLLFCIDLNLVKLQSLGVLLEILVTTPFNFPFPD